ncbi:MAG: cytochrome c3 family protein [Deltaproteobacteria bacterium]|nr:cytochrome c3 family protein [Deltaproteobacteria bacterium]
MDALQLSTAPAPLGADIELTCRAHDPDGQVTRVRFEVSAGTLPGGVTTLDLDLVPPSPHTATTVVWTAPAAATPAVTVACSVFDSGGFLPTPLQSVVFARSVAVADVQPVVVTEIQVAPTLIRPGQTSELLAITSAPVGSTLSHVWSASAGTITGEADADPERVTWTAPVVLGAQEVTVVVSDTLGVTSERTVEVEVASAIFGASLPVPAGSITFFPNRIIDVPTGGVWASDPRRRQIVRYTESGALAAVLAARGVPTGLVPTSDGGVWVADSEGGWLYRLDASGGVVQAAGQGAGELSGALDLVGLPGGDLLALESTPPRVSRYASSGLRLWRRLLPSGYRPIAAGVDQTNGHVWLSETRYSVLLEVDDQGFVLGTFGVQGSNPGELVRPAGNLRQADGERLIVDAFQSVLVDFASDGTFLGTIGGHGHVSGLLHSPQDVAVGPSGRIWIADAGNGRVVTYLPPTGVQPILCAGDADCDGLPDGWEVLNGTDPNDARDAWADPDGDGLANLDEYFNGTDPFDPDGDGDGVPDGQELHAGRNPNDASDQLPWVSVEPVVTTPPRYLRLQPTSLGDPTNEPLTLLWRQIDGPEPVELLEERKDHVALRRAGIYHFGLTVSDASATLPEVVTEIEVMNLPPSPDLRPIVDAMVGEAVTLSAAFSHDANGDPLSFRWSQLGGPAVALNDPRIAEVTLTPAINGTYVFEVEVTDADGLSATGRTTLRVDGPGARLPTAVAPERIAALVGEEVILDGSGSVDPDGDVLALNWDQLEGPVVSLQRPTPGVATFTAPEAGVYRFRLGAFDPAGEGLPAEVLVMIDEPGDSLPRISPEPTFGGNLLKPVTLDCGADLDADGQAITCLFEQLGGATVFLERLDPARVRFFPLAVGHYRFAVQADDGRLVGPAVELAGSIHDPLGAQVPIVLASAGEGRIGDTITLDGTRSFDANGADRPGYLWYQVNGPRAALGGRSSTLATFAPELPGLYRFGLTADDGRYLGRSALVELEVPPEEVPPIFVGSEVFPSATEVPGLTPDGGTDPDGGVDGGSTDGGGEPDGGPAVDGGADGGTPPVDPQAGCGCQQSGEGGGPLLALLVLALLALPRRRAGVRLFALLLAGSLAGPAAATDPPHGIGEIPSGCAACHVGHQSAGLTLTSVSGNVNLCLSCHDTNAFPLSLGDQATPGTAGTSHRWDAAVDNPTLAANFPTDPEMAIRLEGGATLMCSTCHDQHLQAKRPADARAPATAGFAGRHFLRSENAYGQMCLNCHQVRDLQDAGHGTWTGAALSHPVNVPLPGSCPVGASGSGCSVCASGFSGTPCAAEACLVDAAACGFGTCGISNPPGCSTSACLPTNHHADLDGTCIADESCVPTSCNSVLGACKTNPSGDEIVCDCPVGFADPACAGCSPGYTLTAGTCVGDTCSAQGAACGAGTCATLTADCNLSDCPGGEHHRDVDAVCVPDTACGVGACGDVSGACQATPNGDEYYCDCPLGFADQVCTTCVTGFSGGGGGGAACTADACVTAGNRCGFGDCVGSGVAIEEQACSNNANQGAGQPCVSTSCVSDGTTVGGAIGTDCSDVGTYTLTFSQTFTTQSIDGTAFRLWMRIAADASWDGGTEEYRCTLSGVTGSGTLSFTFSEASLGAGTHGTACTDINFTEQWCWAAAPSAAGTVQLQQGSHTLSCTITGSDVNEFAGFDGIFFTTDTAKTPNDTNTCGGDAAFTAGTCQNWGPNVYDPGTPSCTCDTGYTGAACDQCDAGYIMRNGVCVNTDPCSGVTCQNGGTCFVDAGDNPVCDCVGQWFGLDCTGCSPLACETVECVAGEHHRDSDKVCIPDEDCLASSCNGVSGACQDTPNLDEIDCDCPMGFTGGDCGTCSAGFTGGGGGGATCSALTCTGTPQRCGYGDCSGPAAGTEVQVCANNAAQGAGQPCVSSSCVGDEINLAGAIGTDCSLDTQQGQGTETITLTQTFTTQSPDGTSFKLWMRVSGDDSIEPGEDYDCTLTGVTGVGTLAFSLTKDGMNAGTYGTGCTGLGFTERWCWAAANANGAIQLDRGGHVLSCTISVNNGEGGQERPGFDGIMFTTNTGYVPAESDTCGGDAAFTGGTCQNWGPNQYVPGGYSCTCDTGYTGAACDQCDTGYTLRNGVCVNTDPCSGVVCEHGGTCYVDQNDSAVCDCTGQWFGATCSQCTPVGNYYCQCPAGYAGPNCDACASGYQARNGECRATNPCTGVTCLNGGTCYVDENEQPICDCVGQYYGTSCGVCDLTPAPVCSCQTGYTGPNCDECDIGAGYFPSDGLCVLGDPCGAGPCRTQNFWSRPLDADADGDTVFDVQLPYIKGAVASDSPSPTYLDHAAQAWPDLTGSFVRFTSGANVNQYRQITSSTATRITWGTALSSAPLKGDTFEVDSDGNITNNIVLASGGGSYTTGNVTCLSCHGPHYADSSSVTYDGPITIGAGDGNLLRRDNDDSLCTGCHALKVHNSDNTSTDYGTWGTTFTCRTCHDPHGSRNIYLVNETIQTPNSGAKAVDFRLMTTGVEPYGLATGTGTGPCEVCHTQTQNVGGTPQFRNSDSTPGTAGHYTTKCVSCHGHSGGFAAGESEGGVECNGCHNDLWVRMNGATTTTLGGATIVSRHAIGNVTLVNDSFDPASPDATWANPLDSVAPAARSCTNMCHNDHPHTEGVLTTHENNLYEDARTAASRTATDPAMATDFDGALSTGGGCTSCHQYPVTIGGELHPAISALSYASSAHDYVTGYYNFHDGSSFGRNCTKCHADPDDSSPTESGLPFAAVHYSRYDSLLHGSPIGNNAAASFLCFECHGTGAGKDIQTPLADTRAHPVLSDTVHDSIAEASAAFGDGTYFGANRHVACQDCHDVHEAGATLHSQGTRTLGGDSPLQGVSGVDVDWSGLGAWTEPAGTAYSVIDPVTAEWQICFKCHSDWAWGTGAPGDTLSGGLRTNLALDFNPNNQRMHAVTRDSTMTTGSFVGGWSAGAEITCSDCHNTDDAASDKGPHGSGVNYMLVGGVWDQNTGGTTANNFCHRCHDPSVYGGNNCSQNSTATGFRVAGGDNLHCRRHGGNVACSGCHGMIPHGWQRPYPIVVDTDPLPYRRPTTGYGFATDSNMANWGPSGSWSESDCHNDIGTCG